ncbi:hypothetical protein [Photobacterium damselae]|uniref:Predicted integral membrane protein n=2 Tax=Photobacterium damselae TaxID=38293 RepID=A0A2T3QPD3_PHODM|nr:hypothetical protein [Photobacterium damselae]EEZ41312.1 conserved hypothetical transmembrane protein [Photobacterium damselae subsp. damselae CIP 102761]PSW87023.1 hypothetical protein CTN07_00370 [Photobacterium damselae]SPY27911.1 Predicted integral membrane protein [Photobacterium damselae]
MSISTQENIRLNRNIWLTILFAAIVSRIVFYALGLWGVDSFVTGKYAEQPVWQTICRFDCVWFYRIIHDGYDLFPQWLSQNNAANWAFMPLQPFLGWVFSHLAFFDDPIDNARFGLILVSNIAFVISLPLVVMTLKQLKFSENTQYTAIWLLCFSPYTVYSMAGYTEPLFIVFVTAVFLFSYRQQWLWVAVFGLLAAITRNLGVFLVFPVLIIAIQHYGLDTFYRFKTQSVKVIAAIWIIPFGFFSYMTYLYFHTGDALAFGHIQIAWGRQLTNPIHWIIYGFNTGGPKLYLAIASLLAFALNLYLVFNKKYPEALFMFICLVLPLSSSLNAMPRYLFGLYPTFLGLAMIVERYPSVKTPLLCVFSAASCFISIGFFSHIMFTV